MAEKIQVTALGYIIFAVVLVCVGSACAVCTTNDAIQIDVVSGSMSASITVSPSLSTNNPFNWSQVFANPGTSYNWYLPPEEQFDIYDGSTKLAHVFQVSFAVQADPVMNFGFSVESYHDGTEFLISSPLITFEPINNPSQGIAYSDVSVGNSTLTGNFPNSKVYRAAYNINGSSHDVFADLIDSPITMPPIADEGPVIQPISGSVASMQGLFNFSLSGSASTASGISEFSIIPEPATITLLSISALVLLRKRRE